MISTRLFTKLHKHKKFWYSTFIGHDTELHAVARYSNSRNLIYDFIKQHPIKHIATMAITTNDEGCIPLDEVAKNPFLNLETKQEVICCFLKIIVEHQHFKPLSELISIDDVLKLYPLANPELIENLKLACEIVNEIRQAVIFSSTHPDFNFLKISTQLEIVDRIKKIRSILKNDINQCTVENTYSLIQRFKSANCGEMTAATIHLLHEKTTKELAASRIKIQNGDHSTVIYGSNPNVVFCDAWLGQIGKFDPCDIAKYLGNCRQLRSPGQSTARFVTTFNPDYHRFAFVNQWTIYPSAKKEKNISAKQKFFASELPAVIYMEQIVSSHQTENRM